MSLLEKCTVMADHALAGSLARAYRPLMAGRADTPALPTAADVDAAALRLKGVAAAAKLLSMPAVIVMPRDAPRPKRERTEALGAEVVLYDRAREDREAIARGIADQRGATLVPPYDDPLIIAGQGTTGREIVEDLAADGVIPDVVIVNASGGGLTAGIALAVKARAPAARLYTAEPQGFDDHARSFRTGRSE